jgi:hypothetical protein
VKPDDIREVFEFGLDHDNTEVQSLTTQALCKLMLFNRFYNDEASISIAYIYMDVNLTYILATSLNDLIILFPQNRE